MKIATWNINGINSRLDQLIDWLGKNEPDVLCLQETKTVDVRFPYRRIQACHYPHISFIGERSYNGVAIISRHPITELQKNFPDDDTDAPKRLLSATINGVRLVNVYVPHGTKPGTDKFTFKLNWIKRLLTFFEKGYSTAEKVVLCGDLNVAPHEMDVWKPSLWKDKTHFSRAEREAIHELKRWGFVDVYRQLNEDEREYTWWSHFHHDFEKDRGLRIDHIWASPVLADTCVDCWIDKAPRALEHPSDHAPVIGEFLS